MAIECVLSETDNLLAAALLGGKGSDHTGSGPAQLLSYAIGQRASDTNCEIDAIVLAAVMRGGLRSRTYAYEELVEAMGEPLSVEMISTDAKVNHRGGPPD